MAESLRQPKQHPKEVLRHRCGGSTYGRMEMDGDRHWCLRHHYISVYYTIQSWGLSWNHVFFVFCFFNRVTKKGNLNIDTRTVGYGIVAGKTRLAGNWIETTSEIDRSNSISFTHVFAYFIYDIIYLYKYWNLNHINPHTIYEWYIYLHLP